MHLSSIIMISLALIFILGSISFSSVDGLTGTEISQGSTVAEYIDLSFPNGGGKDPSLSLLVPQGGELTRSSMIISTIPGRPGPDTISIDVGLDNHAEWSFGGGAQGNFGFQGNYSDGSNSRRGVIGPSGLSFSFFLPLGSEPIGGSIQVNSPPTPEGMFSSTLIQLNEHSLPLDATDAADINGDGSLELIYFDKDDSAVYAIDKIDNGSASKTSIASGIDNLTSLRAVSRTDTKPAYVVMSCTRGDMNEVDLLTGNSTTSMDIHIISSGLPDRSSGFFIDPATGSITVLDGSSGKVVLVTVGADGDPVKKTILDRSFMAGSISSADMDGDGDLDILLIPPMDSHGNITYCEAISTVGGPIYNYEDTGVVAISSSLGAVVDIDGDGKDEIYTLLGSEERLGVIFLDEEGETKTTWIGLNHSRGTPRTVVRDIYGSGNSYSGGEGLLVYSTYNGVYHILTKGKAGSDHIWRKASTFDSLAIPTILDGDLCYLSLEKDLSIRAYDVKWSHVENVVISRRSTEVQVNIDQIRGQEVNILGLSIAEISDPQMSSGSGVLFSRFDMMVQGEAGFISLVDLAVIYDVDLDASSSPIFCDQLKMTLKDFEGTIIPFSVDATSSGNVRIGPVAIDYDAPPFVHDDLPEQIIIQEGANGRSIFNIRDHISDDYLLPQGLDVELIVAEELPDDLLFLDRNGNLVAQPFKYPDLNGNYMFAFKISDLRNTVQTPPIELVIQPTQDPPLLVNDVGTVSLVEGENVEIRLSGPDGLYLEPDGDELLYIYSIIDPDPLDLDDTVVISVENDVLTIDPSIDGRGCHFRLDIRAYDKMMEPEDGTLAMIDVSIEDIDASPWLERRKEPIYLREDQDTPSRISLESWVTDPDTYLSEYSYTVYSSQPRLDAYIRDIGSIPYLFLHPRDELTGKASIMLEMNRGDETLEILINVIIDPVNDLPVVHMDGKDLIENRGWLVSGHISDPDSREGFVEYRIGDGSWRGAWGFQSWSLVIDHENLPLGGGFIFLRAFDGQDYSATTYMKLERPEEIPEVVVDHPVVVDDDDEGPFIPNPPSSDGVDIAPTDPDSEDLPWVAIGGIGGLMLALIIFFGWTEVGLVIMATMGGSIYSKLSRKDILNHEVRGLIRGYIIANPGDHYSSIKRNLDLNNGTLAYHLRVLEQSGFIKSMYDGIYKRYYPSNVNISKLKKNVSKQEEIFNVILEHPGVTMEQIGRMIGVSRQVVNYHVKNLIRAGIVIYNRDRKSAKFFPSDEGGHNFEQT